MKNVPGRRSILEVQNEGEMRYFMVLTDTRYQMQTGCCMACRVVDSAHNESSALRIPVKELSMCIDPTSVVILDVTDKIRTVGSASISEYKNVLQVLLPLLGADALFAS